MQDNLLLRNFQKYLYKKSEAIQFNFRRTVDREKYKIQKTSGENVIFYHHKFDRIIGSNDNSLSALIWVEASFF